MRVRGGWLIGLLVAGMTIVGCARKMPQEVVDVNRSLGEAKDACAGVYAPDDLQSVSSQVDAMNSLADDKKYRKARKEAEPIMPRIASLQDRADQARQTARGEAEAAISQAGKAMDGAKGAEAETFASAELSRARSKLDEARAAFDDPCKYREAAGLAAEAGRLAGAARDAAVAEKKRREEEARRAEAERKRLEEEARRREEEERLRRFPPSYTVQRGDSLWAITGMETIYGRPTFWPVVYDANSGKIADPDLIYPGQELSIPRGMTPTEMDKKLHMLWRRLAAGAPAEE